MVLRRIFTPDHNVSQDEIMESKVSDGIRTQLQALVDILELSEQTQDFVSQCQLLTNADDIVIDQNLR